MGTLMGRRKKQTEEILRPVTGLKKQGKKRNVRRTRKRHLPKKKSSRKNN